MTCLLNFDLRFRIVNLVSLEKSPDQHPYTIIIIVQDFRLIIKHFLSS